MSRKERMLAEEWERRLERHGLGMYAGLRDWLIYVGLLGIDSDIDLARSAECLDAVRYRV